MGFWGRIFERKAVALDHRSAPGSYLLDYPESKSGPSVNWKTSLNVTTVLACVQVIANGVAQVPLKVYRPGPSGRGSTAAVDHPLYRVLYRRPNPWQTSFQFRQTLVFHRALTGNFFAFKNRVNGEIRELIPFEPGSVEVIRNRDLTLTYRVTSSANQSSRQDFPQEAIWHLRGTSWNSWFGLEPVKLAREAIGLAMAAETSQAELHKNGLQTSGLYSVNGDLSPERYTLLRGWIDEHLASQRHRPLIGDKDAKFTPIGMKGVDAEHLATRKFQIEEICRAFRVFPQMVGHAGDQTPTFASAEQFFIAHVVHTLAPWYEDIEQSIDVDLLREDDEAFAKFTVQGLMRGALADRYNAYAQALGSSGRGGWLTKNEVRAWEEMNPIEGGDELPEDAVPGGDKPPGEPDDEGA